MSTNEYSVTNIENIQHLSEENIYRRYKMEKKNTL